MAATDAGANSARYDVVVTNLAGSVTSAVTEVTIADSWFVNLSARAWAGVGEDSIQQGFVLGLSHQSLLVRAVGPTLADFEAASVLSDLRLEVIRLSDRSTLAANDDWQDDEGPDLHEMTARLGAFALGEGSKDAADFVLTQTAGSYSIVSTGADAGTGIVLTEIYEEGQGSGRLVNLSTRARVRAGDRVLTGGFVNRVGGGI
ncbi:MAG: hypothetical protein J6386_17230 [Candidatus Synoicihabitans palmerolidicus]|nr:hypothetical protein [Candidatus Synoicihabitans palmerolidicus]